MRFYVSPASPEVMPCVGGGGFAGVGVEEGLGKDGDGWAGKGAAGEEGGAGGAGDVFGVVQGAFLAVQVDVFRHGGEDMGEEGGAGEGGEEGIAELLAVAHGRPLETAESRFADLCEQRIERAQALEIEVTVEPAGAMQEFVAQKIGLHGEALGGVESGAVDHFQRRHIGIRPELVMPAGMMVPPALGPRAGLLGERSRAEPDLMQEAGEAGGEGGWRVDDGGWERALCAALRTILHLRSSILRFPQRELADVHRLGRQLHGHALEAEPAATPDSVTSEAELAGESFGASEFEGEAVGGGAEIPINLATGGSVADAAIGEQGEQAVIVADAVIDEGRGGQLGCRRKKKTALTQRLPAVKAGRGRVPVGGEFGEEEAALALVPEAGDGRVRRVEPPFVEVAVLEEALIGKIVLAHGAGQRGDPAGGHGVGLAEPPPGEVKGFLIAVDVAVIKIAVRVQVQG